MIMRKSLLENITQERRSEIITKELSIENIKKELINKISNNSDILGIFRKHEYSKNEGKYLREYGDSFIKDNYIFKG